MNKINIRLFGAFRNFTSDESITLEVKEASTAQEVKNAVGIYFKKLHRNFDEKLIEESALSTESKVLTLDDIINTKDKLAILPPVCGG